MWKAQWLPFLHKHSNVNQGNQRISVCESVILVVPVIAEHIHYICVYYIVNISFFLNRKSEKIKIIEEMSKQKQVFQIIIK